MKTIRFLLVILLLSMLSWATVPASQAQGGSAFDRIDDALADLSIQLGRTLTRSNTEWRWTERTYSDTSLGCPDPNAVYTQVETVGLSITLVASGTEYNYRSTKDGSIFFQCVDGQPAGTSTDTPSVIATTPAPVVSGSAQILPASDWWAWSFSVNEDRLYLLNAQGEQLSMPRPLPPNKVLDPNSIQNPVISRDSRYMVLPYQLSNGNAAFGIYDVASGQFIKVHEALPGETIELGYWVSTYGNPYIFDETGQFVAVAYSNLNFENPELSTWRMGIYELATGNAVYFIDNTHPNLPFTDGEDISFTFPRIVYYGEDTLDVQMIYAFGEGVYDVPAFRWHPNANYFEKSPYTKISADISSVTGEQVFAYMDNGFSSVAPFSPAIPFNAIGQGDLANPTLLWVDGTAAHSSAIWTASDNMVLYRTYSGPEDYGRWNALSITNKSALVLDSAIQDVTPLPNGFLAMSNNGSLSYYNADTMPQSLTIWQSPASGYAQVIWASQPNRPFALTSITIPNNTTTLAPVPTATVFVPTPNTVSSSNNNCGSAPPVRMTLNTLGRVTFTDGTPTRLRQAPNGTIIIEMVEGTSFTVVGGPLCASPFNWWQVQLSNGLQGWVAEGSANVYYIEPLP